jgi:hypothetical protein
MRLLIVGLLALALAAPASAEPFRALNRLHVVPLSADSFEVIEAYGEGGRGIWCAAADYTREIGRDAPKQRLFIAEGRGPAQTRPDRMSVVFTLVPNDDPATRPVFTWVTTRNVGASLPVFLAYTFCDDFREGPLFRF